MTVAGKYVQPWRALYVAGVFDAVLPKFDTFKVAETIRLADAVLPAWNQTWRKPADERDEDKRDKMYTAWRGRARYAHECNGVRSWEDTWLSHTAR